MCLPPQQWSRVSFCLDTFVFHTNFTVYLKCLNLTVNNTLTWVTWRERDLYIQWNLTSNIQFTCSIVTCGAPIWQAGSRPALSEVERSPEMGFLRLWEGFISLAASAEMPGLMGWGAGKVLPGASGHTYTHKEQGWAWWNCRMLLLHPWRKLRPRKRNEGHKRGQWERHTQSHLLTPLVLPTTF